MAQMDDLEARGTIGPNRGEMGPTDRVSPEDGKASLYDMIARGRPLPSEVPLPQGDPRMAAAMQQKLQQLMQDPVARAGIQAHMQGGDPRMAGARMAMQQGPPPGMMGGAGQGGFSSPTTDKALYDTQAANQGVRGNLPPIADKGGYTGYGDEDTPQDPRQTPMPMKPGEEQDMVSQEIDRKGATFDGTNAPTQNDIERLVSDPTAQAVKAFDVQFGDGAADKYLGGEQDKTAEEEKAATEQDYSPEDAEHYK